MDWRRRAALLVGFFFVLNENVFASEAVRTDVDTQGNVYLYLSQDAESVVVCSALLEECQTGEILSPGVFTFPEMNGKKWPEMFHVHMSSGGAKSMMIVDKSSTEELSRGTYVIIGAAIAAISAYGLRVVEFMGTSVFRRRRAIARLRANLLELREAFSLGQSVTAPEIAQGLTSFGKVYLQRDIRRLLALSTKVTINKLTVKEISDELDKIDNALARRKLYAIVDIG